MDYRRMNKLARSETYLSGKRYTAQFEEWLMRTGQERGLELVRQIKATMKEKEKVKKGNPKKPHSDPHRVPLSQIEPLVEAIIESGIPLRDTSGIRDLEDAIRKRKEVNEYHMIDGTADEGHPHFVAVLMEVLRKLTRATTNNKIKNNSTEQPQPLLVFVSWNLTGEDKVEEEGNQTKAPQVETGAKANLRLNPWYHGKGQPLKTKHHHATPSTNDGVQQEQEFRVLMFLYELCRLRIAIRHTFIQYNARKITLTMAALVSDLVQCIVQKNTAAVVGRLENIYKEEEGATNHNASTKRKGTIPKGAEKRPTSQDTNRYDSAQVGGHQGDLGREIPHTDKPKRPALIEFARKLYSTIVPSAQSHGTRMGNVSESNQNIRNDFCLAAMSHMEAYLPLRYPGDQNSTDVQEADYDYMPFLLYFDKKRIQNMKLPIAD